MMYYSQAVLIYKKTCKSYFNDDICNNLNEHTDALDVVQEKASHWALAFNLSFGFPALLSCAYIGSWADKYSRKLGVLLPSVGALIAAVIYVINAAVPGAPIALIIALCL